MPVPVFLSLLFYISTLCATSTSYGRSFMSLRWLALVVLFVVSGAHWSSSRKPHGRGVNSAGRAVVALYLATTFLSVVTANNLTFSGLRWATHAMMVVIFLLFLGESLTVRGARLMLGVVGVSSAVLVFGSILFPATRFGSAHYLHGLTRESNTLGHIALICALISLGGIISARVKWSRILQGVVFCASAWMVFSTRSRSSAGAFLLGTGLLLWCYGIVRWETAWVAVLIVGLLILGAPASQTWVKAFILKKESLETETKDSISMTRVFATRTPGWTKSWNGFKERPILGWGFGADPEMQEDWDIGTTGLGIAKRDALGDEFRLLEGCGVVGFGGYLLLMVFAVRQMPSRRQPWLARQAWNSRTAEGPPGLHLAQHLHFVAYAITVALTVLFQFESSMLSAGYLLAAFFWMALGVAYGFRMQSQGGMAEVGPEVMSRPLNMRRGYLGSRRTGPEVGVGMGGDSGSKREPMTATSFRGRVARR